MPLPQDLQEKLTDEENAAANAYEAQGVLMKQCLRNIDRARLKLVQSTDRTQTGAMDYEWAAEHANLAGLANEVAAAYSQLALVCTRYTELAPALRDIYARLFAEAAEVK